jgi:energy-coupling factor transport system permease protein
MQGFFYVQAPRTVWLRLGAWNFYREGFWYGLTQGLRLTMTLAAGLALVYSTPADRIMHGLRSSGIPQGLCFLLMTALRFLPLIGRETRTAWLALRMRGFRLFRQSPVLSVQSCCGLLRPILAASVRRSEVLATSLVLRGFGGEIRIGPAIKDPLPVFQRILAVVALLATVVLLLLKLLQLLYLYELFYFPAFRPLYAFARAWL